MVSNTYNPTRVRHPGNMVQDYLESFGWTQQDLARRSGLTPKTISEICNGKASISTETAMAFEKVFGRPTHFWMNLQSKHDEFRARITEVENSPVWIEWAKKFPIRQMKAYGWIPEKGSIEADAYSLLKFMGVSSPDSWNSVWQSARVAYRQTLKTQTDTHAIFAWVRATELSARDLDLEKFDDTSLIRSIPRLRNCTRLPIVQGLDEVQKITAESGVASVVVPALPKTGISGLVRWANSTVILALSLRYKTDDQIWFTFFHEIGHILLHGKKQDFILDNTDDDLADGGVDPCMQKYEDEANRFAADILIPPRDLHEFLSKKSFSNEAIQEFSDKISISPGIVVGRLQRESILKPHQGNALKQRVELHLQQESEE